MKLSTREALGYFRKPDPKRAGILIFGTDPMRVAQRRQEVILGLVGPEGEAEMRLTRIAAADLRKDPALVIDALKSISFFPGPRVTFVEDATDGLTKILADALKDWAEGDAQLVVTAGQLTGKSALKTLFEAHPNAYSVGLYDDPPSRDEIEAMLTAAKLTNISRDAMDGLMALSRQLEPGDFRQTIEKLGLYMMGADGAVSTDDIAAVAPRSTEADLDDVLSAVAEARVTEIGPVLRRLYSQGVLPVTLCIGAMRHFRALHAAASDPGGPSVGVGKLRPPAFGPRRDAIVRQAGNWGRDRLEKAITLLTDTDLQLRSADRAPQQALTERMLIRLAMMARR